MSDDGERPEHSYADRWQLETAVKLQFEYGHDWVTASHLAALMRDAGVQRPAPLCLLVTGI
jgi:hypothetical protein